MNSKAILITSLIFSLLFCGCKKINPELAIDSDILVEAEEAENGHVVINAETKEIYECYNYQIKYSTRSFAQTITIRFKRIDKPGVCLTATGPATAKIDLGKLDNADYKIKFKHNGETTKGTLEVGSTVSLDLESNGNVKKQP